MTVREITFEQMCSPAFWREICPVLTIDAGDASSSIDVAGFVAHDLEARQRQLVDEGYFELPALFSRSLAQEVGAAVRAIQGLGLPAAFVYLFDQPWLMLRAAAPVVAKVMGGPFAILANFWAWHVDGAGGSGAFAVHRDYYQPLFGPGWRPLAVNLWIALSDARPPASCLYFLPASLDPNFPHQLERTEVTCLQDIRAVPAETGTLIGVGANVLHWGSRGVGWAPPRVSLAVEIQSAYAAPLESRAWLPHEIPSFYDRLRLIGRQLQLFQHHCPDNPALATLARALTVDMPVPA